MYLLIYLLIYILCVCCHLPFSLADSRVYLLVNFSYPTPLSNPTYLLTYLSQFSADPTTLLLSYVLLSDWISEAYWYG